jgi:predicted O-methyltransferase YrrM
MFSPRGIVRHCSTLITQPGYFYRRLQVMVFQLTHPGAPWLTQEAVSFLARNLRPEMRGFEWGSGRSTIWLAERVNRLVSVEHDPQWYEAICSSAAARNVDYRLAQGADYARQIGEFPDEYFDFVLVDGEFREACLRAAAPKVRRGGLLILDNADYEFDTSALFEYDRQATHNGVWRTDIFVRRK